MSRLQSGAKEQALAYLDQEANALYRQGEEFGDNAALLDTITRCRTLLQHRPRERVPLQWAMTQNNLGTALSTLGERESGTARLEEAVQAYRDALDIFDTADVEYYRTIVQRNFWTEHHQFWVASSAFFACRIGRSGEGERGRPRCLENEEF